MIEFLAAALRIATPLLFAALGGVLCESAGVFAVGLEGMMLMGAFAAATGAWATGSAAAGVALSLLGGGAMGGVLALVAVRARGRTRWPRASPPTFSPPPRQLRPAGARRRRARRFDPPDAAAALADPRPRRSAGSGAAADRPAAADLSGNRAHRRPRRVSAPHAGRPFAARDGREPRRRFRRREKSAALADAGGVGGRRGGGARRRCARVAAGRRLHRQYDGRARLSGAGLADRRALAPMARRRRSSFGCRPLAYR